MRFLIIIACSLVLASCGSTLKYIDVASPKESGAVTLTSKCDATCKKVIKERYGNDKKASYLIVKKINGVSGQGTHFDPHGSFNGSWDGGYNLLVRSGDISISYKPNSVGRYNGPDRALSFFAKSGKKYILAKVSNFEKGKTNSVAKSNWFPLVMDASNHEVIFPNGEPEYDSYCFFKQEFAAATSCD